MADKPAVVLIRLSGHGQLPRRQSTGAAGFDLHAAADAIVPAHGCAAVDTGVALQLPANVEAQVRPRSGLAFARGIGVLNSPGTIDPDFRGEIRVMLFNVSDRDCAVHAGDRVAQLVFSQLVPVELVPSELLTNTERGAGGFGHTGNRG